MTLRKLFAFVTIAIVSTTSTASSLGEATIHNGPPGTFRLDDRGDAIDAHDGDIQYFDGRYYLYGTQYGCGYIWNEKGAPFCGFHAYSSTDLTHWRDEGALFDSGTPAWQKRCDGSTYGCYRPHVVYNAKTRRYVLWINSYDVSVGYHVFTASVPNGPFVEAPPPRLAINTEQPPGLNHGDHDIFVDQDGTAYLAYTDWRRKGDIVVEQLDADYLTGTGRHVRLGLKATEAPSLFRRGDTYYMTYSDPNCGYCATGTSYLHARSPMGPWRGKPEANGTGDALLHRGLPISTDSCGGQPADVATLPGRDGPTFLYQSDRWHHGDPNEALATHYWEPLRFDADGAIQPLRCAPSFAVFVPGASADRASPWGTVEEIGNARGFTQAVTMIRSGHLRDITVPAFRRGPGDGALTIRVTRRGAGEGAGPELASRTVPAKEVSWSPRQVTLAMDAPVQQGDVLVVTLRAADAHPAYGVLVAPSATAGPSEAAIHVRVDDE